MAAAAGSGGAGAGTNAGDEPPTSRPKKPMLAAAGIVGALLIAVPLLLVGQDRDSEGPPAANAAGTVLDTSRSGVPDTYTSQSPSPSAKPSKKGKEKEQGKAEEKGKPEEKEKEEASAPVVSNQTLGPSSSGSSGKPEAKKTKTMEPTLIEKGSGTAELTAANSPKDEGVERCSEGKVCLFDGASLAGDVLQLDAVDNRNIGAAWNDRATSLWNRSDRNVCIWTDADFRGISYIIAPGKTQELWYLYDNAVTSIEVHYGDSCGS